MITKAIEIRDRSTFIATVAIKMRPANEAQRYLMARVGFWDGCGLILLRMVDQRASSDPYAWGGRTMPVAHNWLLEHFDEIEDGGVVDVEFILGETREPKVSERIEWPLGD